MSTSTVKLYYSGGSYGQWELLPGKLLKVDNISAYLATKSFLQVNTVQYQKLKLEMQLKLDLSQNYAVPLTGTTFKYLSIQNSDQSTHYYFVKKIDWASLSCVVFDLVLDVLNTFQETTDYVFKENTRIVREHKDRFKRANFVVRYSKDDLLDHNDYVSVGDGVHFEIFGEPGDYFEGSVDSLTETGIVIRYENVTIRLLERFLFENQGKIVISNGSEWEYYDTLKLLDYEFGVYRVIDYIPEAINPVLECGEGNGEALEDKAPLNQHWHLLYRNVNDPSDSEAANLSNPVECYLIPEEATGIRTGAITNGRLNYSSLQLGKVYLLPFDGNSYNDIITLDDGTTIGSGYCAQYNDISAYIVLYRNHNNRIVVNVVVETTYTNTKTLAFESEYITLHHLPRAYVKNDLPSLPDNYTQWKYLADNGTAGSWSNTSTAQMSDSIDSLDRTDAKNIKLIKLPYAPYDFKLSGGNIDISNDQNWSFANIPQSNGTDCYALKLNDINTKLFHDITPAHMTADPYWYLKVHTSADAVKNARGNDARIDGDLESKLYNSEFFQPTYFYDSFSFKHDLEKCNIDWYVEHMIGEDGHPANIRFTMTKTINSKFSFNFGDYHLRLSLSNLPTIMPIARNNDEVLYNVPYLNYIRTGFNYDVKAKNLQNASNQAGIAISGASMLASLLLPTVPLKVAGVLGSLASMAMSIKGAVVANQSAENSIQSKLMQHRNQTDSVAGSDDVDLMTEYCGNRLRYVEYVPNPTMKRLLNDLFFYAGYRSDRMGIPNHNTRIHFDYLECEASLQSLRSIPDDCLKELANSFKAGVTYMHRESGSYDFAQTLENWESSLFD